MKNIILWIWQLPQHIVALIAIKVTRAYRAKHFNSALIYCYNCKSNLGGAHGKYILMPCNANKTWIKHEYGHVRQSKRWGWLYYLVIGLPSVISLWLVRRGTLTHVQRMNSWPEKQADRLGGVTRRAA